jgi:HEAT repeat protein
VWSFGLNTTIARLESDDPAERQDAAKKLITSANDSAVPALTAKLNDVDLVAHPCAEALGNLAKKKLVAAIVALSAGLNSFEKQARWLASCALLELMSKKLWSPACNSEMARFLVAGGVRACSSTRGSCN